MDNLRLILIVVATLAIIALLVHGFWINKKERSTIFSRSLNQQKLTNAQQSSWRAESDEVSGASNADLVSTNKAFPNDTLMTFNETVKSELLSERGDIENQLPLQRDFFLDAIAPPAVDTEGSTVQSFEKSVSEPPFIEADVDSVTDNFFHERHLTDSDEMIEMKEIAKQSIPTDVLVMHVTGINGNSLNGHALLKSILSAGFQHGDMEIFHRHVDPAGNGAILYSLANMVKPGYLNPDTMSDMVTPGISLFMMVPSFGDDQQNFKMMLQSAQRIADDIKGIVLDDDYHMITPQKIDDYKERIKNLTSK